MPALTPEQEAVLLEAGIPVGYPGSYDIGALARQYAASEEARRQAYARQVEALRQKREGLRGLLADPYNRELAAQAGISAAGQAAELALMTAPTAMDRYARQEQERLEREGFGLTPAERRAIEEPMARRAARSTTEQRAATEQYLAAAGGTSAADIQRARRLQQQGDVEAALRIGETVAREEIRAAAEDLARYDQLKAYQAQRQQQRRGAWADALGAMAGVIGRGMAARPGRQIDYSALYGAGLETGTAAEVARLAETDPAAARRLLALMMEQG